MSKIMFGAAAATAAPKINKVDLEIELERNVSKNSVYQMTVDIFKFLLHQRGQIPVPYDLLLRGCNKSPALQPSNSGGSASKRGSWLAKSPNEEPLLWVDSDIAPSAPPTPFGVSNIFSDTSPNNVIELNQRKSHGFVTDSNLARIRRIREETRQQRRQQQDTKTRRTYAKKSTTAISTIDCIVQRLEEIFYQDSSVTSIAFVVGATLLTPKEIYEVNIPPSCLKDMFSPDNCHNNQPPGNKRSHRAIAASLMRTLVTSDKLWKLLGDFVSLTNIYVLVRCRRRPILPGMVLILRDTFDPAETRGKRVILNLQSADAPSDSRTPIAAKSSQFSVTATPQFATKSATPLFGCLGPSAVLREMNGFPAATIVGTPVASATALSPMRSPLAFVLETSSASFPVAGSGDSPMQIDENYPLDGHATGNTLSGCGLEIPFQTPVSKYRSFLSENPFESEAMMAVSCSGRCGDATVPCGAFEKCCRLSGSQENGVIGGEKSSAHYGEKMGDDEKLVWYQFPEVFRGFKDRSSKEAGGYLAF